MNPLKAALLTYGFTIFFAMGIALVVHFMAVILRRASAPPVTPGAPTTSGTPPPPNDAHIAIAVAAARSKTP
ncbi:MAG: hypothetical protein ACYC23_01615 [Limisphaerales bacterium]